tara:strand:+ start:1402 stop:1554 length:153 start_codon:yes stop_codon:yes gene_type:complete
MAELVQAVDYLLAIVADEGVISDWEKNHPDYRVSRLNEIADLLKQVKEQV